MGDEPDHSPPADEVISDAGEALRLPVAPELSYWFRTRIELFGALRERGLPQELIDPVQLGLHQARVVWEDAQGNPSEFGKAGTSFTIDKTDAAKQIAAFNASFDRRNDISIRNTPPASAGELLAFLLRLSLVKLRDARNSIKQGKGSKGPRSEGSDAIPEGVIRQAANDLVVDCHINGYSPGQHLTALLSELMLGSPMTLKQRKDNLAKEKVIWLRAQDETIPVRELARLAGMSHSTVLEWLKDPVVKRQIQAVREFSKQPWFKAITLPLAQP